MNFQKANDNITLTVNTGCCWDSVNPLSPTLLTQMQESGLFVPHLFLRWPMFKGATCPAEFSINNVNHGTGTGTVFECIATDFPSSAPPLTITTHHLPDATVGKHYHAALKATRGSKQNYRWTVQKGSHLPAGLTLSAKGVLSGVPIKHGQFPIRVTVNNSASAT